MQVIRRLALSAFGMHTADQIAVTAVPLLAAVAFDASAQVIGILVACQTLAHLIGSIPAGLIVDRTAPRFGAIAAAAISALGFAGVAASIHFGSLAGFAACVTVAGFGVVLFVLVALSTIPLVAAAGSITAANSNVEIARAIPTLAVPFVVGQLAQHGVTVGVFALAAAAATAALLLNSRLPHFEPARRQETNVFLSILEGGRFVARQPLLRPIAICAIFWNFAFSALLVILVPLLLDHYKAPPGAFGVALSAFGSAMIAGTWTIGRISGSIAPGIVLVFGPGSSFLAVLALALLPAGGPVWAIYLVTFFLGFGPSMWLIAQNSIRQLVTPRPMLGRVNAVIQTAIYGVRPLGALAGGFVAGTLSPHAGVLFVATAFGLSAAAALFSPLRTVGSFADLSEDGDLARA